MRSIYYDNPINIWMTRNHEKLRLYLISVLIFIRDGYRKDRTCWVVGIKINVFVKQF